MVIGHEVLGSGAQKVMIMHDWLGNHTNYDLARPFFDVHRFSYAFVDLRGYGWLRLVARAHGRPHGYGGGKRRHHPGRSSRLAAIPRGRALDERHGRPAPRGRCRPARAKGRRR